MNLWRQYKGQAACEECFLKAISAGRATPIAFGEIPDASRVVSELAGCQEASWVG